MPPEKATTNNLTTSNFFTYCNLAPSLVIMRAVGTKEESEVKGKGVREEIEIQKSRNPEVLASTCSSKLKKH